MKKNISIKVIIIIIINIIIIITILNHSVGSINVR